MTVARSANFRPWAVEAGLARELSLSEADQALVAESTIKADEMSLGGAIAHPECAFSESGLEMHCRSMVCTPSTPIVQNEVNLRIFLPTARAGSLGYAALRLGVDTATVGRRIARLESTLKSTLLIRSRAGLQLTAVGAQLTEIALDAESAMDAAVRVPRPDLVAGTIRISTAEGFGSVILAPALAGLAAMRPDLRPRNPLPRRDSARAAVDASEFVHPGSARHHGQRRRCGHPALLHVRGPGAGAWRCNRPGAQAMARHASRGPRDSERQGGLRMAAAARP